ncbi:hypothetical protein [Actinophytocola sp.]|uniref:hypothetical protein n=1 Tax=Actinophytocola sp. TaxID=1872138 RepID=UPI002ED887C1
MTNAPRPVVERRLFMTSVVVAGLAVVALVAVLALIVGGTGSRGAPAGARPAAHDMAGMPAATSTPAAPAKPAKPARPMTVRQLAAAMGCTAKLGGKAADFRQATCTVAGSPLVLLDFDTAEGQRAWLEMSQMYGGVYLVGERWALSGRSKEYLEELSGRLGGDVEEGSVH